MRWWGHRWFWWRNPRERDHLEDLAVDGRIILKTWDEEVWPPLIWSWTGTGCGLL